MDHHIKKLMIEFDAADFQGAREQQQALSRWAGSEQLWKAANEVLDAHDLAGQVIRIPRLELEVSFDNETMFQTAFLASLGKKLGLEISKMQHRTIDEHRSNPDHEENQLLTSDENAFQAMIFYLKNGVLPWYLPRHEESFFNAFFRDFIYKGTSEQIQHLRQEVMINDLIFRRWFTVLGAVEVFDFIIRQLVKIPLQAEWTAQFWSEIQAASSKEDEKYFFLKTIFLHVDEINAGNLPDFKAAIRSFMSASAKELPGVNEMPEKALFIPNAGIVLLAAYLEQLFKATGLIEQRHFRSQAAQERAILMLHYLSEGETTAWEYHFPIFKLLCGVPLKMPVNTTLELSQSEKQVCDELLQFAIAQWTIMRNASLAGLRETFLKRPGKLWQKEDDSWHLVIEKKTEDVLLERLPSGWSFSILKLPWMPQILYVEW